MYKRRIFIFDLSDTCGQFCCLKRSVENVNYDYDDNKIDDDEKFIVKGNHNKLNGCCIDVAWQGALWS